MRRVNTGKGRRILAAALTILLLGSSLGPAPKAGAAGSVILQNPRISEQGGELDEASGLRNPRIKMKVRDVVTFGSYWQEDTNGDGEADQMDEKQPIRWQVLSVNDTDVFLLSERVLDFLPYEAEAETVTWENSSIRKWLNEEFYRDAFSEEERAAIKETAVTNADNPEYGTDGGADTRDKVFLPSIEEVSSTAYGFDGDIDLDDQARMAKVTPYAGQPGEDTITRGGDGGWWLRSPGYAGDAAAYVFNSGIVNSYGDSLSIDLDGIRPALHLDLSVMQLEKAAEVETGLDESEWDLVELGTTKEGQPMEWRVLSIRDGDAYLMADRLMADRKIHDIREDVTWENSSLRSWLNGEFFQNTFKEEEKKGIRNYNWENEDNPWYGTDGGADTMDFVSLPSLSDMTSKEYGFPTEFWCDSPARTAYVQDDDYRPTDYWWLRSIGEIGTYVAYIGDEGAALPFGTHVDAENAVRPALHFDLTAASLKKTGTLSTKDENPGQTPSLPPEDDGTGTDNPSKPTGPSGGDSTGGSSGGNGSASQPPADGTPVTPGTDIGNDKPKTEAKPAKVSSVKAKNKKKKTVILTWKKAARAKKYQIQYSQNKKFKKAKTKTTAKRSYKITKLKKKKTYYFRVRAVSAHGKKGAWSKQAKVKIKK